MRNYKETKDNYMENLKDVCIIAMEIAGLYYDDWGSVEDEEDSYLKFIDDYDGMIVFGSWQEVMEWMEGVDFEDEGITRRVTRIIKKWNEA